MNASLELLDVFFRFAGIGQLLLIVVNLVQRWPPTTNGSLLVSLCPCVAAYLLLTAPFSEQLDDFRGVLLVLTHATPWLLWLLGVSLFERLNIPKRWSLAVWVLIGSFAIWHIYFFGYLQGVGRFHDVSHAVYIVLLVHLVYMAIRGMADDLMESRRRARVFLLAVVSVQLLLVTIVELAGINLIEARVSNALNAGVFLVVTTIVASHLFRSAQAEILKDDSTTRSASPAGTDAHPAIPAIDRKLHDDLRRFLAAGGYRQTNLTIERLADTLSAPQHHLRRLINQHLGYRNFSTFLNAYRIEDACRRLADPDQIRTPILTIALDTGYGSIGPFNRAFKATVGQTPSEYRNKFNK